MPATIHHTHHVQHHHRHQKTDVSNAEGYGISLKPGEWIPVYPATDAEAARIRAQYVVPDYVMQQGQNLLPEPARVSDSYITEDAQPLFYDGYGCFAGKSFFTFRYEQGTGLCQTNVYMISFLGSADFKDLSCYVERIDTGYRLVCTMPPHAPTLKPFAP